METDYIESVDSLIVDNCGGFRIMNTNIRPKTRILFTNRLIVCIAN